MSGADSSAYHEAGHAVVAIAQGLTVRVATIIPDRQSHGRVSTPFRGPPPDLAIEESRAFAKMERHVLSALAGAVAQRIYGRSLQRYPRDDRLARGRF